MWCNHQSTLDFKDVISPNLLVKSGGCMLLSPRITSYLLHFITTWWILPHMIATRCVYIYIYKDVHHTISYHIISYEFSMMICLNIICSYLFESLVPLPCQEAQDSSQAAEAAKTQLQEAEATCGNGSMWFSSGETRHPGEIPADLMCVYISCFKQFDLLFCWILKKVLLQLRWNWQIEKPGCSGRGTASGRGVSQKGEGGGDGQNGRCHQMSSECGDLDNPNLGSIQSKQAQEVAKELAFASQTTNITTQTNTYIYI